MRRLHRTPLRRGRASRRRVHVAGAVLLGLCTASGAYAYTAGNVVPDSTAGAGVGAITGYTVGSIAYDLNNTDPEQLDRLTFTLSPSAAGTVKVRLRGGGSWYACGNVAGNVSCPADGVFAAAEKVTGANGLTVVAIQNADS